MLDICLLGTGGMMPLPYRWLTSLMVRYNGMSILIDAGEGTQVAMKKKGWSPKPIDVICFTHYHADHISGLPGLLLSMGNAERTEPLLLIGPRGLERVVNSLRVIAPELPFEILYHEIQGLTEVIRLSDLPEFSRVRPDDYREYKDFKLTAFRVNHNVTCYGYSMELARAGRFDVGRANALGIEKRYWSRLQKGEYIESVTGRKLSDEEVEILSDVPTPEAMPEGILSPAMVLGPARKGLKLTYTTDTRPCDSIRENAVGSDLFICEGMYGEPDKIDKAKEHKHMTFYEAAHLAADAGVKEMWLTHYSPSLVHPEEFMGDVRKIFSNAVAAKDGRSVDLMFEEEE